MPVSPNQHNYWVFYSTETVLCLCWGGEANLKADSECSLDGKSFKHMKKAMGFTVCLDHACQGNSWAIIVLEDPWAAGKDSHKNFAEWDADWGELQSWSKPQECSSFPLTEKEDFTNILKQRRLAAVLVCQQVSHLEGQATPGKGICHTAVGQSFVSLCFRRRDCVEKKGGSNISSASMQDSPKEDKYPLQEIQEFSGTGKRIWAKESTFTNKTSE